MQRLKSIAPQLFPILSKRQAEILELWFNLSPQQIGAYLDITTMTVYSELRDLRNMGILIPGKKRVMMQYAYWMDFQIRQRF